MKVTVYMCRRHGGTYKRVGLRPKKLTATRCVLCDVERRRMGRAMLQDWRDER